jgi:rSAM/selenodomain-associated transferase 1
MKRRLVIFARAPQFGRVKRRLAEAIGPAATMRFYRRTLDRQIRTLSHDRRWTVCLFVTPDHAVDHPAWQRANVRGQGQGDLGQRMKRPFRLLPPGPVVLVGSDIPAMRPRHIARAFALLGDHDLVFGPATDGGFWLIGARRSRPLPRSLFAKVRWSTRHALADTLATIPPGYTTAIADTLDDVDDANDLRRWHGC